MCDVKLKGFSDKLSMIKFKMVRKDTELSQEDIKLVKAVELTKNYLKIYDATEATNKLLVFQLLFLDVRRERRTLDSIAADVGMCVRGLNRIKNNLLLVFSTIYESL
jgi:hypothetical protein